MEQILSYLMTKVARKALYGFRRGIRYRIRRRVLHLARTGIAIALLSMIPCIIAI